MWTRNLFLRAVVGRHLMIRRIFCDRSGQKWVHPVLASPVISRLLLRSLIHFRILLWLIFVCPVIQSQKNRPSNACRSNTSSNCKCQSHRNSRESKCHSSGFHLAVLIYSFLDGPFSVAWPDEMSSRIWEFRLSGVMMERTIAGATLESLHSMYSTIELPERGSHFASVPRPLYMWIMSEASGFPYFVL